MYWWSENYEQDADDNHSKGYCVMMEEGELTVQINDASDADAALYAVLGYALAHGMGIRLLDYYICIRD
jgi:hypothetical protein